MCSFDVQKRTARSPGVSVASGERASPVVALDTGPA